jgi:hypothetical protein
VPAVLQLQAMPDGYLKLGTGQGSCYKLRAALRIFPDHLPLVAYNSCSTLSATKMAELTNFFKHADCPFLETFQASFNGSQAAPVQPPGPSRCVLRVGGWEGGFFLQVCWPEYALAALLSSYPRLVFAGHCRPWCRQPRWRPLQPRPLRSRRPRRRQVG